MKESRYNFWSKTIRGEKLLFNGRTGALLKISEDEVAEKIKQSLKLESEEYSNELIKGGFLWNGSEESEVDAIESRRKRQYSNVLDILISPTYDCNFRCTYCYVDFNEHRMSKEVEERVFKYFDNVFQTNKEVNITWFGGEPLLVWEQVARMTVEIRTLAEKWNAKATFLLTTNGYLLSEDVMDKLYLSGIRYIHVTIDGCDQGQDTRRVTKDNEKTFDIVLKNFVDAIEKHMDLHGVLRMNLEPDSINEAVFLLPMIPAHIRNRIQVHPTPVILEGVERDSNFHVNVARVIYLALELGFDYYNNDVPVGRQVHCGAENVNNFQIGPNGNLHKCSPSYKPEVTVGVINEFGNAEFNNNNVVWQQHSDVSSKCRQCKFFCFCLGGCRLDRVRCKNDVHCRDKFIAIEQYVQIYHKAVELKKI